MNLGSAKTEINLDKRNRMAGLVFKIASDKLTANDETAKDLIGCINDAFQARKSARRNWPARSASPRPGSEAGLPIGATI